MYIGILAPIWPGLELCTDKSCSGVPFHNNKLYQSILTLFSIFLFSGETAFKHLSIPYGWAKFPMVNRIGKLEKRVPITFVHGARSWVENESAYAVKYLRQDNYVDVQVIKGAGHHVYADRCDNFNTVVDKVFELVDTAEQVEDPVLLESSV